MWSRGAVVIVKRGDEAMADAIEKGIDIKAVASKEVKDLERKYALLKMRDDKTTEERIQEAEALYGYNWVPPRWSRRIVEGFAFIVYWISIFVEKYLVIR